MRHDLSIAYMFVMICAWYHLPRTLVHTEDELRVAFAGDVTRVAILVFSFALEAVQPNANNRFTICFGSLKST